MKPHVRVALVDDHEMVLRGLSTWLRAEDSRIEVVAATTNWMDLLDCLDQGNQAVDVILLDLDLKDGIALSTKMTTLNAIGCAVVVMSTFSDARVVREAAGVGALGFVPKSEPPETLVTAIRAAAQGNFYFHDEGGRLLFGTPASNTRAQLSEQEREALRLYVFTGLPMKSVARRMGISQHTAKSYLDRVRTKLERTGTRPADKLELRQRVINEGWLTELIRTAPETRIRPDSAQG